MKPQSIRVNIPLILLLITAFVLRSWGLELKPPHFDEGINGHFVTEIWKNGFYRYDPTNFHGPLYFYVLQLAELIFGRGLFAFRFVNGLISLGIVGLIAMHRRFFGNAALWAAWLVALSPAFVFYSRYAIHESLFVLLQVAFVYGYFSYREEKSQAAVIWMAAGVLLSVAVKETFFIFFGTWLIAVGLVRWAERFFSLDSLETQAGSSMPVTRSDVFSIVSLFAFIVLLLFSGFFMYPRGLVDMVAAFNVWAKTGTGASGHEKPFFYYLKLMSLYEWPFLLAMLVAPLALWIKGRSERILTLTGGGLFLAYSLIPYKTPWLILSVLWPLAFVIGFVVSRWDVLGTIKGIGLLRPAFKPLLLAAMLVAAYTMLRLNFRDYAASGEPYVYVQTTNQFKYAIDVLEARRAKFPEDLTMKILVLNRDPWPLPWVLDRYPNLQFGKAASADLGGADVILIDSVSRDAVISRLPGAYWEMPFKIREAYDNGSAFFAFEKFKGFVPSETPVLGAKP
jgi:uncharacterized protein (TIGR03663 family)